VGDLSAKGGSFLEEPNKKPDLKTKSGRGGKKKSAFPIKRNPLFRENTRWDGKKKTTTETAVLTNAQVN